MCRPKLYPKSCHKDESSDHATVDSDSSAVQSPQSNSMGLDLEIGISRTEVKQENIRRKVSFPESVVTDTIYRVYTNPNERKELYYSSEDYKRFRNDFRQIKMAFMKMKREQNERAAAKLEYLNDSETDSKELSCFERVTHVTSKILDAIC